MRKLKLHEGTNTAVLFGHHDRHLKLVESELGVRMSARGEELVIDGPPDAERKAEQVISELATLIAQGYDLRQDDVHVALAAVRNGGDQTIKDLLASPIAIATRKRAVAPKTPTQKLYIEAIERHDIVIAIGPAGTGKTYLAMAMAVQALAQREVSRIILARPAVEAGEKLGFLPGDMFAKVNPYLRPLYDALYDMMELERANRLVERGEIEIAPLAFMRGRTLNDSFVILDEAQNATAEQMKMFLTRLGNNSKAVVTGDITQVDLPNDKVSGLVEIREILHRIDGIEFVYFNDLDVVRHRLVQDIIRAYDRHQATKHPGRSDHERGTSPSALGSRTRPPFPAALPPDRTSSGSQPH